MFKTLCIVLLAAATAYASWGGGFRYPGFGQWSRHSYQPYISLGNGVFAGYDGFNSFGGHGGYHGPGHFGGFGFGGGFGGGYGGGFGGFGKY